MENVWPYSVDDVRAWTVIKPETDTSIACADNKRFKHLPKPRFGKNLYFFREPA